MSMVLTQVRIPEKLSKEVDFIIKKGFYENKSDFFRDAIRRRVFEEQLRSVESKGDSVKEIKRIRKKLSQQKVDLDEINSLK
jgi:Arc/MetJ-type ribon-helix-helix transcriptional regulator